MLDSKTGRMQLSKEQQLTLLRLAENADGLAILLRGAAHLGEKGHYSVVNELDKSFTLLKHIVDGTKRFIKDVR